MVPMHASTDNVIDLTSYRAARNARTASTPVSAGIAFVPMPVMFGMCWVPMWMPVSTSPARQDHA